MKVADEEKNKQQVQSEVLTNLDCGDSSAIMTEYDAALHQEIHRAMLAADPAVLLNNKRVNIFPTVVAKIGSIHGNVADVGCGSGYLSIWMALNQPDIDTIHAIEGSKTAVDEVIPNNTRHFGVSKKVHPIYGSFDFLSPNAYDFIFAMGALHHSRNLSKTLRSIAGALKSGGYLIAQEPTMPDVTTHQEYQHKYDIVEERFGLKFKNADRYDRFFRECEYKSAIVKSGLDIVMWEDFNPSRIGHSSILKLAEFFRLVSKSGIKTVLHKIAAKFIGTQQDKNSDHSEWQIKLRNATQNVRPKLIVAQKSEIDTIYHDD